MSSCSWPSHKAMTVVVDTGFEETHCCGVTKDVGADLLGSERRAAD